METEFKIGSQIIVTDNMNVQSIRTIEKEFKKYWVDSKGQKWNKALAGMLFPMFRDEWSRMNAVMATEEMLVNIRTRRTLQLIQVVIRPFVGNITVQFNARHLSLARTALDQLQTIEKQIKDMEDGNGQG